MFKKKLQLLSECKYNFDFRCAKRSDNLLECEQKNVDLQIAKDYYGIYSTNLALFKFYKLSIYGKKSSFN